jgi:uncharacterized delta-60 repeat protein
MKKILTPLLVSLLLTLCLPVDVPAADGTPLWTNIFNGVANGADETRSLAVDGSGNVYVAGYSQGSGSGYDFATLKYSSAGVPLWTNLFNGAANGTDKAYTLAVDGSGNVYVTGGTYHGGGYSDYATIKYSSAGTAVWTNLFDGGGNSDDWAEALAVDGDGNVYVTGGSNRGVSYSDYVTIKYSSAGVPLWTNRFNGAGNGDDKAYALALDTSGNLYVTGYSTGSGSSEDYATIKYSSAGAPVWTNRYNGAGNSTDEAYALAVDGSGNVYVTGYTLNSGSFYDYATIKYSSGGVPMWTNLFNGAANGRDLARALAVDGSGNVYVTGYSDGIGSSEDYATIKYSNAGVPVWTNRYNGAGNSTDEAYALAVDGSGNVYVTGQSQGSGYDYATIKYSSAGVPLWTNRFNGAGNSYDGAFALAVDGNGNVYVTGCSQGSGSGFDCATIKYSGPPPFRFVTTGDRFGFTNQQFRLTLTGPAGSNAVISASTNLQSWTPLATNPLMGDSLNFTDTLATNFIQRFYRAHLQ